MPSLNKVTIIGHLGKDPEIRAMQSGDSVGSFSVATSESYKDKSGQWVDKTEWHRVSVFNQHALKAVEKLSKGSLVYVEGKIQTREYKDKEGNTKYSTEIVVSNFNGLVLPMEKQEKALAASTDDVPRPAAKPATLDDGETIPF